MFIIDTSKVILKVRVSHMQLKVMERFRNKSMINIGLTMIFVPFIGIGWFELFYVTLQQSLLLLI